MQEFLARSVINPSNAILIILLLMPLCTWRRRYAERPFALLNLVGAYLICLFSTSQNGDQLVPDKACVVGTSACFAVYILLVVGNYLLCREARCLAVDGH